MPRFFYKKIDHEYELAVWRIEENERFFLSKLRLTKEDEHQLQRFQNPTRRLEWLASRYLLRYILNPDEPIHLSTDKKPKTIPEKLPS